MNPHTKTTWLAALESDDYQPSANAYLATRLYGDTAPPKYSPLGVLCEVAQQAGIELVKTECSSKWALGYVLTAYDGETLSLPVAVREWAGIGGDGNYYVDWYRNGLLYAKWTIAYIHSQLKSPTFYEIATLIKQNY